MIAQKNGDIMHRSANCFVLKTGTHKIYSFSSAFVIAVPFCRLQRRPYPNLAFDLDDLGDLTS